MRKEKEKNYTTKHIRENYGHQVGHLLHNPFGNEKKKAQYDGQR